MTEVNRDNRDRGTMDKFVNAIPVSFEFFYFIKSIRLLVIN